MPPRLPPSSSPLPSRSPPPGQNGAITGRVWSAAGLLLEGAGARLFPAADSTLRRIVGTDRLGYFAFDQVLPGDYVLTVILIGYERYREEVEVTGATTLELDIALAPQAIQLEGLAVEAERSRARARFERIRRRDRPGDQR